MRVCSHCRSTRVMLQKAMTNPIPILAYHSLHAAGRDYSTDDHVGLLVDLETIGDRGFRMAPLTDVGAARHWNRRVLPRRWPLGCIGLR
jgi:hypothetical protein